MIITTFLASRHMILKTGWAEDPQQRMVQRLMLYGVPFSLLISGAIFPIGVVIYWVTQNLFSLGQQTWVLRRFPPPKANGTAGAAQPTGRPVAPSGRRPSQRHTSRDRIRPTSGRNAPYAPGVPRERGPEQGGEPR